MLARSVVLVLAVLVGAYAQHLDESDEVSLLQNEVVTRTRKGVKKSKPEVKEDVDDSASPESFCQALSADEPKNAACLLDKKTSAIEEQTAPAADSAQAVIDEEATSPEQTRAASGVLGYLLDVLIIAIFWDGLRRWNLKQKTAVKAVQNTSSPPMSPVRTDADWDNMMNAALSGNLAQCETLLRKGVPLARADVWGCTVLHAAAKGGCAPLIKLLLEKRAGGIDRPDAWDETPLHIAARAGHIEVCEVLLAHGARINVVNAQDWTALVVAADANQEDVCNLLMGRGAIAEGLAGDLPPLLTKLLAQRVYEQEDTGFST